MDRLYVRLPWKLTGWKIDIKSESTGGPRRWQDGHQKDPYMKGPRHREATADRLFKAGLRV